MSKLEEFNHLWEMFKIQQRNFFSNFSLRTSQKSNATVDQFEGFPFYKNVNSWEELQTIIHCHYNRSFPLHSLQQKNQDQDCHPFGNVFDVIYSYYIPSMILVGLLGNLLSCFVFLNTHLKMRSSSFYLAALACADFGFLASLFLVWLNGTLEIPVFNIEGYCQCIVYVSSVCSFLSVWLIAAFTVERFIAVQYPLHRPHMCTVARAKAIVFYLVCISLTANTYVFVTSGIIRLEDGSEVCEMLEGHREAMRVINIIDSVLTLIAPLLLIVIMNAMIVYNLIKFSKKFKKPGNESDFLKSRRADVYLEIFRSMEPYQDSEINTPLITLKNYGFKKYKEKTRMDIMAASFGLYILNGQKEAAFWRGRSSMKSNKDSSNDSSRKNTVQETPFFIRSNTSFQRLSQFKFSTKNNINGRKPETRTGKEEKFIKMNSDKKLISTRSQQNITKMLLLISSVFVLLNLPSYGIRLYVFIFFSIWSESPPVLLWCMQQLFMILYYTNFSINFILYSMCGITFRRCLWQILRKKPKKISKYQ